MIDDTPAADQLRELEEQREMGFGPIVPTSVEGYIHAHRQLWMQAGADAAVKALNEAGLLRQKRTVAMKRVIRDGAGAIIGVIEEPVTVQDAS